MKPLILPCHSRPIGNPVVIGLIALLAAGFPPLLFAAESLKLETYYPSPSGIFKNLRVSGDAFVATAGGNLGVGTTSPQFKLDVQGSTQSARIGRVETGAWPQDTSYAYWGHASFNHATSPSYALLQGNLGDTYLNAASDQNITFGIGNASKMTIKSNGNIGIGTTSPNPAGTTSWSPVLTLGSSVISNKAPVVEFQALDTGTGTSELGLLTFRNYSIGGDNRVAQINVNRDGAIDNGSFLFFTKESGVSLKRRMMIKSSGQLVLYNQDDANLYYTMQSWKTTEDTQTINWFTIEPGDLTANGDEAFVIRKADINKTIKMSAHGVVIKSPYAPAQNKNIFLISANNGSSPVFAVYSNGGVSVKSGITIQDDLDAAESFPIAVKDLEAGDVVSISRELVKVDFDENKKNSVDPPKLAGLAKTNKAHEKAAGVISTKPGVLLSGNLKNSQPLALAGRVPTKVTLENGPIEPGDHLAASSTPGHAMKATKPGHAVGIALEPFDGKNGKTGKIMVLIQPGWWPGDTQEELVSLRDENEKLKLRLDKLERRLAGVRP